MSRAENFEKLRAVLVKTFELRENQVTPTSRLVEDLELDSLDWVDLIVRLEQETGQEITEDELPTIRTVADILDVIDRKSSSRT